MKSHTQIPARIGVAEGTVVAVRASASPLRPPEPERTKVDAIGWLTQRWIRYWSSALLVSRMDCWWVRDVEVVADRLALCPLRRPWHLQASRGGRRREIGGELVIGRVARIVGVGIRRSARVEAVRRDGSWDRGGAAIPERVMRRVTPRPSRTLQPWAAPLKHGVSERKNCWLVTAGPPSGLCPLRVFASGSETFDCSST